MRIRTVKPEFWTHPVLMRKDHGTRLLAIGLLNFADDEGYFIADEDVIRGALMPKEISTNVRRMIDDLSRIGYIRIVDHSEMGPIGWVVKFKDHQRVDRANQSKLKVYFGCGTPTAPTTSEAFDEHSTNIRRIIDEQSSTEQGTGNREQVSKIDTDVSIVHLDSQTHDGGLEIDQAGSQGELPIPAPKDLSQRIVDLYHDNCPSLPKVKVVTATRKQSVKSRWKEYKGDERAFRILFQTAEYSDFLSGRNGRWSGCNFDWLLKSANMIRVLEGNYNNPENRKAL
jgi:hypothetical protein